jgi:hypothetical protein
VPFLDLIYRLYRMALRDARPKEFLVNRIIRFHSTKLTTSIDGVCWRQQRRNAAYRQEVFEHLLGDVIKLQNRRHL